jgi:uridine phosphorylase
MTKRKNTKRTKKSKVQVRGSEIVEDIDKRQYHIGVAPGEVASTIIIVGDPYRAEKVASFFDEGSIRVKRVNREFHTFTGTYKEMPISVISTGIGPSNIEIFLIELTLILPANLSERPVIIRVGSSGSLQEEINIGDLVISTGAVRLEDTSLQFVENSYPSIADFEVITALVSAAEQEKIRYFVGITASASGFYGAQGRDIPNFPINDSGLPDKLKNRKVLNFEMESSTLFTLASLVNYRAGTVCAVYANRPKNKFIDKNVKKEAEIRAIKCGLTAALLINKMDKIKAKHNNTLWNAFLSLNTVDE